MLIVAAAWSAVLRLEHPELRHPTFSSSCSPRVGSARQIKKFYLKNDILLTTRGPRRALPRTVLLDARGRVRATRSEWQRGRGVARESPVTVSAVNELAHECQGALGRTQTYNSLNRELVDFLPGVGSEELPVLPAHLREKRTRGQQGPGRHGGPARPLNTTAGASRMERDSWRTPGPSFRPEEEKGRHARWQCPTFRYFKSF